MRKQQNNGNRSNRRGNPTTHFISKIERKKISILFILKSSNLKNYSVQSSAVRFN